MKPYWRSAHIHILLLPLLMSSRAASDEAYDEDEDVGDSISVVASTLARRRRAASTRGSEAVGDDSYVSNCWLCGGQEPLTTTWLGRLLDTLCWSAIRCHHRLLPDAAAKTSDRQRMLHDVDNWKDAVLLRRMGSEGSIARADARKDAKGIIIERAGYNDQSQIGDDILLTKRPFCAHMRLWEGNNTEGASESIDERLGKSESDHEDDGGRKRVGVTDYARLRTHSGTRAEAKSSRGGDAVGGGGVARDRGAERGRSQERQRRGRHGGRHRQPKRSRSPAPSRGASRSIRGGRSRVNRTAASTSATIPVKVDKGSLARGGDGPPRRWETMCCSS